MCRYFASLLLMLVASGCGPSFPPVAPPPVELGTSSPCVTISQRAAQSVAVLHHPDETEGFSVKAGERLCLDADPGDAGFKNWRSAASPSPTIDVNLGWTGRDTTLFVRNGTTSPIKFRAAIVLAGRPGAHASSVCPIAPHGGDFEMWPQPVAAVVVWDVHVLGPNESTACER